MNPTYEEKLAAVRYENNWSWVCPCPPEDVQDDHNFVAWIDNHGEWIYLPS